MSPPVSTPRSRFLHDSTSYFLDLLGPPSMSARARAALCRRTIQYFPIIRCAPHRRRTPAKYSQLVPQLDDFIIPAPCVCRGRPLPRGGLVRRSPHPPQMPLAPLFTPSRPPFSLIAFFLPASLPSTISAFNECCTR